MGWLPRQNRIYPEIGLRYVRRMYALLDERGFMVPDPRSGDLQLEKLLSVE
jgi:hypothetical protein